MHFLPLQQILTNQVTDGAPTCKVQRNFEKRIVSVGTCAQPPRHLFPASSPVTEERIHSCPPSLMITIVNPNADTVEGDRSYHDLHSIPGGVDGA
jgi:hypothetical protein